MSVGRVCTRVVATAAPSETVLAVARRMEEYNVGTLPVIKPSGTVVGIVTDRDIALRCVARARDPETTPVSVIMSRTVRTVNQSVPIEDALRTMADVDVRRLVVTDDDQKLVGLLSLDDVLELLTEEAEAIGALLRRGKPRL